MKGVTLIRHRERERVIAIALATLAGYTDALGFLELGGFFVSFMSGNSTRLGVGIAGGTSLALVPFGLVVLFVAGVVLGSLIGRRAREKRQSRVLAGVTVLLLAAAAFQEIGHGVLAVAAMVLAMGAENTVFERDGEVSIGVTYMTGTLVKLGQRLTEALLGGKRLAWIWYLLLWLGLVGGAVIGTIAYRSLGLDSLWIAAVVSAILSAAAAVLMDDQAHSPADRSKSTPP